MMDLGFLEPIRELLADEAVREQISETARTHFSGAGMTINIIPAVLTAIGVVVLLPLLLPLLADSGLLQGSAFGQSLFARKDTVYYSGAIASLQQQVAALEESDAYLRSALYYGQDGGAQAANSVGYTS